MMERLTIWWRARSGRERWMVSAMLALLVPLLLWLCVWRPVQTALLSAREEHSLATLRYGAVRALVKDLNAQALNSRRPRPVDLSRTVSESANEAGFVINQIALQRDGHLAVNIASARVSAFLVWLSTLEGQGVVVKSATLSPAGSAISAQLLLSDAGR
jgi:general secretion pathway protein M